MTRADIESVLIRVPSLTAWGANNHTSPAPDEADTPEQRAEAVARAREHLLRSADDCTRVVEWLRKLRPTKRVSPTSGIGCYHLKHVFEHESKRYVPVGPFAAAAIFAGFPYRVAGIEVVIGVHPGSVPRCR